MAQLDTGGVGRASRPKASAASRPTGHFIWQPRPVNVWVAGEAFNSLEAHALAELRKRLEARGCVFVTTPDQATALGPVAHLAIGFGKSLEEEANPRRIYGRLPKPRGSVLMITATDRIPEDDLFAFARGQLLRKAAHMGITVEGDVQGTQARRALWAAMAGNYRLLEDKETAIFDSLALRAQANAGAQRVTSHEGDDETRLSWEQWCRSPLHSDIAQAAHALGSAGIIEDRVSLEQFGSSQQAGTVLRFLERAALGEGMRSQLDPALRIMGVTASGGGKINVSPDPMAGHVVPISQLTWNGYVRALPRGCPIIYAAPSVETHENGMIYLAGAVVNAGLVSGFESFLQFLADHFARHERIDILPSGLQPTVLAIDHFHRHPDKASIDQAKVEIVSPDRAVFPEIDFPCGVRESELNLLSAVFQAKSFRARGPLAKTVIAVLPGHGSVAISGASRQELTDILLHGINMGQVAGV